MNIKIVINEKSNSTLNCTLYENTTKTNIGTLWLTRQEFEDFTNMLTYGITSDNTLEIEDPTDYDG